MDKYVSLQRSGLRYIFHRIDIAMVVVYITVIQVYEFHYRAMYCIFYILVIQVYKFHYKAIYLLCLIHFDNSSI